MYVGEGAICKEREQARVATLRAQMLFKLILEERVGEANGCCWGFQLCREDLE